MIGLRLCKVSKLETPLSSRQTTSASITVLYEHTGLRGSDVVRLGPTDVDTYQGRDAFALTTQKRKRDVWCPIMPTLATEMATWERRPGPYLLQQNGKPFTRKEFGRQFAEARDAIPELKGLTLHGLRATAVINLRRAGAATPTCARTAAPR